MDCMGYNPLDFFFPCKPCEVCSFRKSRFETYSEDLYRFIRVCDCVHDCLFYESKGFPNAGGFAPDMLFNLYHHKQPDNDDRRCLKIVQLFSPELRTVVHKDSCLSEIWEKEYDYEERNRCFYHNDDYSLNVN